VSRPWLWAADNHAIRNRGDGDGGLLSLADILDMSSSQEPGRANRVQKQRLIAAASVAGAEVRVLTGGGNGLGRSRQAGVLERNPRKERDTTNRADVNNYARSAAELFTTSPRRLHGRSTEL
jgi:hypothetical protein